MSTTPSLPAYTEVEDALKKLSTHYDAAQTHGLMCGLISATSGKKNTHWEDMLGGKKDLHSHEVLLQLYEISYHQMSEFSFEFSLLLPDDDVGINQRAEALGLWCQGFLAGLEKGKVPIQNREESEMTEALNDLVEISQVNYDDIANNNENEEDETAYFELIEYVRLAVLMIFQELQSIHRNNLLH